MGAEGGTTMTATTAPVPTLQQVLDAFIDETRGDPSPGIDGTELWLETVQGVMVAVYLDTWTYYGPIWNARLHIPLQGFTAPLVEGPHADVHQSVEDALPGIVAWMREITDSVAEKMDPLDA